MSYTAKLSGPVVERLPIRVVFPPLSIEEQLAPEEGEPSESVRERVLLAREMQQRRYEGTGLHCNDDLDPSTMHLVGLDDVGALRDAIAANKLSPRGAHNLCKVGRTVADLAGDERVQAKHIQEAVRYLEIQLPRE